MGGHHLQACRLRPAPGSLFRVPSAPPGLEEGPRITPGNDGLSLPVQHKPAWSFDRGGVGCVCVCVCVCVCEGRDPGSPVSYPVSPGTRGPGGGGGSEGEPRPGAPQKRKPGAQSGRNLLEASRETWRFWEGGGPASCKLFAAICEVQPLPESAGAQDVLHGVCPHPTPPWVQHPPLLPALPPSIPLGRNTSGRLLIPTKPPTSSDLRT